MSHHHHEHEHGPQDRPPSHVHAEDAGPRLIWAHLLVDSLEEWPEVLAAARHLLAAQGIAHVTLQPEPSRKTVRWIVQNEEAKS